jgi:glucokinase
MIQRARDLLPTYPDSALGRLPEGMPLDAHAIFTYAEAGDPLAQRLASEAVEALGKALVNLINLLNPEIIVVGGGVFADGWLLPRLRAVVERDALAGALRTLRGIHLSTLQPDLVGLLGAAVLAFDRLLCEKEEG